MNHGTGERWRDVASVAFVGGIVCGFGEAIGLLAAQAARRSRWPITFSCGSDVVWGAPLLDALLFVAIALLGGGLLAMVRVRGRLRFIVAGVAALLAFDWARLTGEVGRPLSAAIALGVGVTALLLASQRGAVPAISAVSRRVLPWLAGLVVLVAAGERWRERSEPSSARAAPAAAPDVLVLILDTVRADHLSCYAAQRPTPPRATTPRIDALAAQGTRFEACFSTSSWTLPAHATMVTGRFAWEHGAHLGPLDEHWPLLPEAFRAAGWRTGAFSANLCFFHRGFGFGRGFDRFDDFGWSWSSRFAGTLFGRELLSKLGNDASNDFLRKPASVIVDRHLDWIDDAPAGRPCFAMLNFFDAHDPYSPPPETAGRFAGDGVAPGPMPPPVEGESRPWDDALLAEEMRLYDECLLAIDAQVGRLVDGLAARGRLDRTLLVIVSDHGESFGERGARLHRGSLHREQVHVPLIFRAPARVAAGATIATPVSLQSLAATLHELAGLEGAAFPGPSLVPLLRGDDEAAPHVIGELARHPWPEYRRRPCFDGATRSLVRGRWHWIWHATCGVELYDWIADPREEHDLADQNEDLVSGFEQELRAALDDLTAHPDSLDATDLSSRPELAGIGYAAGG